MFTLKKLVKESTPRVPFKKIKESVLGKRYPLSLVLCGNMLSKKLNKEYRKKNAPTNILSFPLGEDGGEIFLNIFQIKKEAKEQKAGVARHTAYVFIHGLLHLKGFSHGSTMEREEAKLLRRFGFSIL
jgi:probable rRNA maturation factor